jgi:hypothetical protein
MIIILNFSESFLVDKTQCFPGQHEHLRHADGGPQQHLQLHPHEGSG